MPQTIAIQRGTTTCASLGTSTLFTQSGGTATRVIPNMLSFLALVSQFNGGFLALTHTSAGGGSHVIGYWMNPVGNMFWSGSIMPANNGIGPAQLGGVQGQIYQTALLYANNQGTYSGNSPGTWNVISSTNGTMYMPSNFWIGPSDSVGVMQRDSTGPTLNIAYSFTTITES